MIFLDILIFAATGIACASEPVTFKSSQCQDLHLTGWIALPPGEGPFPAFVFMHGCGIKEEKWQGLF